MTILFIGLIIICSLTYMTDIEKLDFFISKIKNCDYTISRVDSNFESHLYHSCVHYLKGWDSRNESFEIITSDVLEDDPDVRGQEYLLVYIGEMCKLKYKVKIARFKYYYEKPYKNKKELLLWLDKDAYHEQNYFAKLVRKLMMGLIQNRLKKRLRE